MKLVNEYLRERFGCKVYKIALDGGFTCPNQAAAESFRKILRSLLPNRSKEEREGFRKKSKMGNILLTFRLIPGPMRRRINWKSCLVKRFIIRT